jgi:hemerythrin superfamily protein
MNAIDLLESQHREAEDLFAKIEGSKSLEKKELAFIELADGIAIHTTIEERHFYPAVKDRRTEEILLESLDEHLAIKRALSELLDTDIDDPSFDAKLEVLKEELESHIEEEEGDLFPRVMRLFDDSELEELGDAMAAEQAELEEKGNPREAVPGEVERAATI